MQTVLFHLMPYPFVEQSATGWPHSNRDFNPIVGHQVYQEYLEEMVEAEVCGFDWVGCNEHHFSPYGLMANPNLMAAVIAARTHSIGIAVMGNLVPLLNPIRVAEEYAMLDVLSGGRLLAGFIRGIAHEYMAYGVAPDESWPRFQEAWALIVKAWTEPVPFAWEGEFYQYRAVSIWPRPLQQPYPPVVMSGGSLQSARFAAHQRVMMGMVQFDTLEQPRLLIQTYRDIAHEDGWDPGADRFMLGLHTCIAETDDAARRILEPAEQYFYTVLSGASRTANRMIVEKTRYYTDAASQAMRVRKVQGQVAMGHASIGERIEAGTVLCGSPETVIAQIRRIRDELGVGCLNLNFHIGNIPHAVVRRGMDLFRSEVGPVIREW